MKGYVEIFDTMLSSLHHFTESDEALSVKEIGYRLGLQTRTAQRIAKALQESGWLTSQKTGAGNFFTATDKAKALFNTSEQNKAKSEAIEFIKEWDADYCKNYIFLAECEGDILPWELELKGIVELLDFVKTYGGIAMAKRQLDLFLRVNLEQGTALSNTVSRLKEAVAVHESIYGQAISDCSLSKSNENERQGSLSIKQDNLDKFKVGDKVEPIDHRYTLASGCSYYSYAYVVSVEPFQLISEMGDMHWRCTVNSEGFRVIPSNGVLPEGVLKRMKREHLDEVLEGPSL